MRAEVKGLPGKMRCARDKGACLGLLPLILVLLCLVLLLLCPTVAQAQPTYTYDAFHTELTINSDGSLLVRNKVTYEFQDTSGWVGLFVPASYGTLVEASVLGGDGAVLPESAWDYEQGADGYTLWCDSSGAGPVATYIFEYLLYDAFEVNDDRVGIAEWAAVPVERDSPIDETSLTVRFPADVDPSLVELDVYPEDYSGQITQRFVGSNTAVIEAAFLSDSASYSIRCSWPASLMDLGGAGFPAQEQKGWEFERFDTDITVNEDSSYTVRETQVAAFRGSFTWLNRDLSTEPAYGFDGRTYGRVRIHDIAVYDLNGEPYDSGLWSVESYAGGKTVRIDFQAQDEQKGWIIEYRMTGALIFAEDYDRLYWDAVSEDRDVAVKSSTITVHLPAGTDMAGVDATQYVDIDVPPSSYDSGLEGEALWWRVEDIPAYTTFTVDVSFPKGTVSKPWQYGSVCGIAVIVSSSVFFAGVFLFMVVLWWRKGRDVDRTGTTMVRYEPPEGLAPAVVGMLVNEKPRVQDISATIVDLARRGYLTIIEEEQRSLIRIKKYAFQRMSDDFSGLLPYEREIMEGLFSAGERVSESDLVNKFYVHMDTILNHGIKEEVMAKGLFTREPGVLRRRYLVAGLLIAVIPLAAVLILPRWFDLGWFTVLLLSFVPVGATVAAVGWAMPRRSREGSQAYEHVMGFRDYMETAEKPELEYMTPENFQVNLPYAMVLGVDDAWAKKFQDIYTTTPAWYTSTGAAFSTVYLTSSLKDMTGHLDSTLTSSPRSSGSGGGGGFGGGSSGGGFGGGGSSAG
jgi:uncharacterized membrane protein YgcG